MKLKLTLFLLLFISVFLVVFNLNTTEKEDYRNEHAKFIDIDPFQKNLHLSKNERKYYALSPNKYFEQEYIYEMNPYTGENESHKLFELQKQLNNYAGRSVPGSNGNNWAERGPNNVPGRTRAIMYDPNDATAKRVFAGGVSGGLWVINDITNSSSVWQKVGIPENLSISSITYDINDTNIFYVGTGESFTAGAVNGNGVWKSSDAGNTWTHVFGGSTGVTSLISNAKLVINSGSISGEYAAVQTTNFGSTLTSITNDLAIVSDGTSNATEGCNPLINGALINGRIAVIDRANCNFTDKVKNAQNEGAVAAIIFNSVSTFPFNMGGTNGTINIPAVMMGQTDGVIIKNAISNGTINATLTAVDNDLPAGIVLIPGKFHVNDIVTRSYNNNTEIYATISESMHNRVSNLLGGEIGLYKSIDGGNTWTMVNIESTPEGDPYAPNDLLITADNKIWMSTTQSWSYGNGGGTVFSSSDGVNFTKKYTHTNGRRTEMAASSTNAYKIYLAIDMGNTADFVKTTTAFSGSSSPNLPNGNENGQARYDLAIAVNPSNDDEVYIGQNYVYKSTNSGSTWSRMTRYYSQTSPGSYVHVDIHNITFNPINSNKGVIGNDGGVYYVSSWNIGSNTIKQRGNGYNTTQFYKGAIGQSTSNEKFLGGAQDNGTNFINNASVGISSSNRIGAGDGMYCFIDKDSQYMVTSVYQNAYSKVTINGSFVYGIVNNQDEGSFVNVAELDDNLDILYSDATTRNTDGSIANAVISRFSGLNGSSSSRYNMTDALLTRPVSAMRVSPYTTNFTTLFVGTDSGSIFKLTRANGGHPTWTDLTPEPYDAAFAGSMSSINFGANEDEILVTFHNYGVVNVYFTEDGGTTWQNKEGDLPDLPVKDILMNPLLNDEVIIATDLGVWKTNNFKDANPHWTRSNDGMQNVKVTSFDLRTADNTILASTYGRGFFTGQFTSTSTVNVNEFKTDATVTSIYPTVSEGNFNIKSSKNLLNTTIQVIDINGKQVYNSNLNISSTETSLSINVESGVYFVNITNGSIKESHKIIIK